MKMISHQRSSSKRKLIVIVILALAGAALLSSPFARIGSMMSYVSRPLAVITVFVPNTFSHLQDLWRGVAVLRSERDALKTERDLQEAEQTALKASISDFEALNTMRTANTGERIIAGVLVLPNVSPYDSLVIDKGERDGVQNGALVYAEGNIPLGTVIRTLRTTSVIALFTSPGVQSHVYVLGPNVHAKATGLGAGALEVLLPHGIQVQEGDAVIMPTLSGEYIGTVAHVRSDPAEPGIIASVVSRAILSSLRYVAIAKEPFVIPTRETIEEHVRMSTSTLDVLFTVPQDLAASTSTTTP